MAARKGRLLPVYTGLVIAYLFVPIVVMILFGFNDPKGRFNFAWQGFTLQWYRELLDIPELTTALQNSLLIAGISTLAATILGTMVALALSRYRMRGRGALNLFVFLPMATPEIVLGVSLLSLFVTLGVARGAVTIVIAHILFSISYVVVTVRARLAGLDHSLEDAAQDLGATPWTTFWTVTFPLIFPGVLAAGMLAFVLSIDDYVITSFNNGSTITFPVFIWGAVRVAIPPQIYVIASMIFLFTLAMMLLTVWQQRRAELMASVRPDEP